MNSDCWQLISLQLSSSSKVSAACPVRKQPGKATARHPRDDTGDRRHLDDTGALGHRWHRVHPVIAFVIAAVIGTVLALKVEMTQMPQLVALLHSFVGLGAVLVGFGSYLEPASSSLQGAEHMIHLIEIYVGVFVGAVTFTGSLVAFGKLQGSITGKALGISVVTVTLY